jgi:hypothetical protein
MLILGIDPGTAVTGYGVVRAGAQMELVECGVIRTKAEQPLPARLKDIAEGVESPMGMVVQNTSDGAVPSCGVWLVRQAAMEFLQSLWPLDGFARSGCWWEQAAVIAALGGDPDATPVSVPNGWWAQLPYEFNPHIGDYRGIGGCRFFHATCFPNRLKAMKEALQ